MKKLFTRISLLAWLCGAGVVTAQTKAPRKATIARASAIAGSVWTKVPVSQAPPAHLLRQNLKKYALYRLDVAALKSQFWALSDNYANASVITLPMPDGTARDFKVWNTPMMEPELAARYPDIRTFSGEAVNDARVTAKFDFTLFGFHAVIFDGEQVAFTDPYDNLNDGYYVLHYKSDEDRPWSQRMKCEVHGDNDQHPGGEILELNHGGSGLPATNLNEIKLPPAANGLNVVEKAKMPKGPTMEAVTTNGTQIRTYRLAVSANNHYCRAATGLTTPTIAQCLSRVTTSINRVNGVYNREISVQLNLVATEDQIIWPTATGSPNGDDPFNAINTNAASCLTQNQTTCDTRIGSANYDVGHVFTTGAGGLAALGVICNNPNKARGVTGSSSPVGDAFDIDYVCHELGHQFGSSHTFNNNVDGSCNGNASSANAYEPASGATIMDYAGICSPDNVQANSSPYFSASSLEQIQFELTGGGGGACAVTTSSGHGIATVTSFTANYNIPYKTPFELTAPTATPSTGDTAITYGWYQWNRGDFGARLNQTFVRGPIFRSYQPAYTETRIFPRLSNVLSGVLSNSGEKAPDTTRYLTFKTVIRNIRAGMGCINIPDDTVHLNAYSTGAANGFRGFRVTSQNTTGIVYTGGSTQTITWDVVSTNAAPVNAANVDIFMSVDGGNTWAYAIGTFPNTGSASVSIPNPPTATSNARIKVKGSGNVFFNINSNNFTVNPGPTTAPITGTFTVCIGATTDLDNATPGGTFTSSTPAVATVNSTNGIVTGVSAGTTTITYVVGTGNVTAVVTVLAAPTVAPITGTAVVCTGLNTTLSNATPGGVWSSSNTAIGTISTSGVFTGISAGNTVISYTVTNGCGAVASTVNATVNAPVVVAPITGTATVCAGSSTVLSNTTPSGVWSSSNTAVATVTAGTVSGISSGTSVISYTVSGGGCTSASSTVVTVNASPVATVSPSGTVAICTGGSQVLTASPSGLSYQWQSGVTDIAGETNATYTATATGNFRVRITNAAGCSSLSAVVTVNATGTAVIPSVVVAATPGTSICSAVGTVTFNATPTNGGITPAYQWYVNGTAVGTSAPAYTYTPANGDVVTCDLTSSLPCATPATVSSSVTMNVTPSVTPGVTVDAIPNDTVCTGNSVTYSAVTVNGGTAPTYVWNINGTNVGTGNTYSTTPLNGDIVICQLTSNVACATATTVISSPFVMTVQAPAANTVAVSASPAVAAPGEPITFVAIAPYGGPAPVYQWFIDGTLVPGATASTFVTSSVSNGQVVHCKVTTSMPCVTPLVGLSNGYTVRVTTSVWETTNSGHVFSVTPNPNHGTFTVNGRLASGSEATITVTNVLGQVVAQSVAIAAGSSIVHTVALPASMPSGVYLVTVTSGTDRATFRVVTEK